MRITKLVLTLSALLMLGACTNTYHGVRDDLHDTYEWSHDRPSHIEQKWGRVPTGYYGQGKRAPLLKPMAMAAQPGPVWNEVGSYDAAPAGQEQGNVTVYPVEGGEPQQYVDNGQVTADVSDYGQLMEELYFAHGSAVIGKADKSKLVKFGHSIKGKDGVALTVVGHASTRVDGVEDPVRRKEINFEMSQKRINAVTMVLKHAGVSPSWIEGVSRGEDDATGNEGTDRRADVYMR